MEQELKICPRCGDPSPLSEFCKRIVTLVSGKKVIRYKICKQCNRDMGNENYKKNPERCRELNRKWGLENPEKKRAAEHRCNKKSRDEISDRYLISVLKKTTGLTADQIRANPLLMEQKRQSIKNYREKKEQKKNKA